MRLFDLKGGVLVICRDHLGNVYRTMSELLEKYQLNSQEYKDLIAAGYSHDEVLASRETNRVDLVDVKQLENGAVEDHLGFKYTSLEDMLCVYGLSRRKFDKRAAAGMSLEEALTKSDNSSRRVADHLGNVFPTTAVMCRVYGIKRCVYDSRLGQGWTLEEALTGREKELKYFDHEGNGFASVRELCEHWGVSQGVYYHHVVMRGRPFKEVLDGLEEPNVFDHLGNGFRSKASMAEHWGISDAVLLDRLKRGKTLEEALTGHWEGSLHCKDHLGNEFSSRSDMARHYGVKPVTLNARLASGWTLKEALCGRPIGDVESTSRSFEAFSSMTDFCGNHFSSYVEACNYWKLDVKSFLNFYSSKLRLCNEIGIGTLRNVSTTTGYANYVKLCEKNGSSFEKYIKYRKLGYTHEQSLCYSTFTF